ncbi:30S ribosomal protein S16 [Maribacter algarum]|uniref:Small ribosomal subunit protein bS16 n=1 Tax=Maribacter algarum (ex Zhang et al. 2020) TaxID=2578118 RepID=A0A5S3QKM6_9FLAO|nr:30S ribosomal protein S16 [Maribacter algarum]TMM58394.1 30S ribosomal protein S16 [Maribacter algarum]
MPVKIRLQRHGKKGKPFYWIVAADARAKRDGKFLEKLGIYNPNTNPATIEVNVDNSVQWLQNGAQPTDTAKAILSYKGVLLKHHLLGGLRKGALTEEQVEEKFNAWLEEKEKAVAAKVSGLDKAKADAKAAALKAEKEVNEKRAIAAAEAELPEVAEGETAEAEGEVAEAATEEVVEAAVEEVAEKAPAAEEAKEEEAAPAASSEEE